jgi:SAM-dependent methyltransferase
MKHHASEFQTPRMVYSLKTQAEFDVIYDSKKEYIDTCEDKIRSSETLQLYCNYCNLIMPMTVDAGPNFGDHYPNLREGLVCRCGAKNRDRLMLLATGPALLASKRPIFFGALGCWAAWARRNCTRTVTFCEYLGTSSPSGSVQTVQGVRVRNEDLTHLTFADNTTDLIVHGDVLEHIPDLQAVFAETYRVLAPGGRTIFTAPFFHENSATTVRAVIENGTVRHIHPPEYHDDPLSEQGILTFYNFGWDLLNIITDAGFEHVRLEWIYEPGMGIVSNGCPYSDLNMLPVYITASKPKAAQQSAH